MIYFELQKMISIIFHKLAEISILHEDYLYSMSINNWTDMHQW